MRTSRLAPAKVNLSLLVGPADDRGYHEVFTVLVPVDMYDRLDFDLEAHPAESAVRELHVRCRAVGGEANLVAQALRSLERVTGWLLSGRVHIDKGIPMGAGLGGGSADAAVALQVGAEALAEAGGPVPDEAAFRVLARGLGADVPFFLDPRPAIGRGIGELLEPVDLPPLALVLILPSSHLSTAQVYRALDESRAASSQVTAGEAGCPETSTAGFASRAAAAEAGWRRVRTVEHMEALLQNDLEPVSFGLLPRLASAKQALLDAGARGAMMSGSGPTLFGVCATEGEARVVAGRVRACGYRVEVVRAGRAVGGGDPVGEEPA